MDLYLARENLSAVQASEAQLEAALARSVHALDVLVGRRPGSVGAPPETLPELPELGPVPTGLPVQLLDRRPDLRGSELQLMAATYGVGVAVADLYPSLSFSASYGTRSERLSDLVDLDHAVYQLLANMVGPLFTGGARRAEVAAAEARMEAAAASYAGTVLTALREVEDALATDAANGTRVEFARRRLAEARAADRLARDRYQRGVANLLTVLETERRVRTAEEAMMSTRAEVWNTRIDLHLALGGDWSAVTGDRPAAQPPSAPSNIPTTSHEVS
jgi:NodT family efflux transporter outer membrane factor (OMF) lipoprotein